MISEIDIRDWGSAPSKPIQSKEEYEHFLKTHDWNYEFSDDFSVWEAGRRFRAYLIEARGFFDEDHVLWDAHNK